MSAYADDVEEWELSHFLEYVKEKICAILGTKVSLCVLRQVLVRDNAGHRWTKFSTLQRKL